MARQVRGRRRRTGERVPSVLALALALAVALGTGSALAAPGQASAPRRAPVVASAGALVRADGVRPIRFGICPGALCPLRPHHVHPTVSHPCPGQPSPGKVAFALGAPQVSEDSAGQLTGVTQSVGIGEVDGGWTLALSAGMCWQVAGSGSATTVGAFGIVDLNGVVLVPESGNPELLVTPAHDTTDASGTIIRASSTSGSAPYLVEVPQNGTDPENVLPARDAGGQVIGPPPEQGAPLIVVGQVDLGADSGTVWSYDASNHVIGTIAASPQAVPVAGRAPTGGQIVTGAFSDPAGQATVQLNVPLPSVFTSGPSSGPAPTGQFYLYTVDLSATLPGNGTGSSSSGGGGGAVPPRIYPPACYYDGFTGRECSPVGYMQARDPGAHPADVPSLSGPQSFTVPSLYLGGLEINNVSLGYDPSQDGGCGGLWSGSGGLTLANYSLTGTFQVCGDGQFLGGAAQLSGDAPIIPGVVDLTGLGVGVHVHPTKLTGNATVSVLGGLVTIPGCVLVAFGDPNEPYTYTASDLAPCSAQPATLQRGGGPIDTFAAGFAGSAQLNVPVFGSIPFASGYGFYVYPSYFEFGGQFDVHVLIGEFKGGVSGWFELAQHRYNLEGNFQACIDWPIGGNSCVGAQGDVSSTGVGGCVSILGADAYAWYAWNGSWAIDFGCDLGPIQLAPARDAQAASGPVTINVPAGLPVASIRLRSASGVPRVSVTGPGGQALSDATPMHGALGPGIAIAPFPKLHTTVVGLFKPPPGTWTITPLPGSVPVTGYSYRYGLGPAHVTGRVVRRHGRYVLHYRVRPRPGQTVTFAERAPGVFDVLGTASGRRGKIRFTPALGPAGPRAIVALIALSGQPDRDRVVTTFRAPAGARAGAAHRLRWSRRHGELILSWRPGAHAVTHLVEVVLDDGRRLLFRVGAGHHSVTVGRVVGGLGAQARIVGFGPDGRPGPVSSGTVAATAPARVHGLKAVRTARGIALRWQPVRGATAYLVHVIVAGAVSGRLIAVARRAHVPASRLLAALGRGTSARISVRAVGGAGAVGRAAILRYSP